MRALKRRLLRLLRFALLVLCLPVLIAAAVAFMMWPGPPQFAKPVHTEAGMVQGITQGGITSYKGIPFAAPPTGDLRWRAPQAVTTWEGMLKADAFKPACMQAGPTVPGMAV